MKKFLCIHGHFYQPPRENAWVEEIELQSTAYPYHDWNERICAECYGPNCFARILDGSGKIVDVVSNYSLMSFNFGPTLLSWLQKKAPAVYDCILEADRESLRRLGHGNAIAQAYNHMILPLANEQDKETQVVWGIEDFRCRFKRYPEAMWLPETAVDSKTLEVLQRFGMKFVILSPVQAQRMRLLGDGEWIDVASGSIDPRRAYRCFLEDSRGNKNHERFIDIFFYDGALSSQLSFGDLLLDGRRLADRLNSLYDPADPGPQLVHAATDGETYGHHKKFGEMAIAYAMRRAAEHDRFEVVNYGSFLKRFPPQWEVELKKGKNNEGTAWSCGHGVGRWKEDCGCRTSGEPRWNQKWRRPLREAMNFLRDTACEIFDLEGKKYFINPLEARNAYIQVILERTDDRIDDFFSQQSLSLDETQRVQALHLLEMQRNAMLMHTSCGWFFDDISGLEATQIMQYADRALQLAQNFTVRDIEGHFVEILSRAHSNIPSCGSGRDIYYRFVRPCRVSMEKVLNHFVISSAFHKTVASHHRLYHYDITVLEHEQKKTNKSFVAAGRINVKSGITCRRQDFFYALGFHGGYHCRSVIRPMIRGMDFAPVKNEFIKNCVEDPKNIFFLMHDFFGDDYYSLRDMFYEEKQEILRRIVESELKTYEEIYAKMYDDTRETMEEVIKEGLVIPWEFKKAAENTLSKRLHSEIAALRDGINDPARRENIRSILTDAQEYGYALDMASSLKLLSEILKDFVDSLREEFCAPHTEELRDCVESVHTTRMEELNDFLEFLNSLHITFNRMASQNVLYIILREKLPLFADRAEKGDENAGKLAAGLLELAEKLDFSSHRFALKGE